MPRILAVCSQVLSFKLLDTANLSQIDRKLVLTGVDYTRANLIDQIQTALKKFIGRSALGQKEEQSSLESTYPSADNFKTLLLSKGRTKPRGGGRGGKRTRILIRAEQSQEKRRKNFIDRDGKVNKCFKCTCKHEREFDCDCTYHLTLPTDAQETWRRIGLTSACSCNPTLKPLVSRNMKKTLSMQSHIWTQVSE